MTEYTLPGRSTQLNRLIQVNIQDLLASFGLENLQFGRKLVEALCWLPARRFASQMAEFDRRVGIGGLHQGSQRTLDRFVSRLEVAGLEHVPSDGPLLVLSNHPGMTDTLALFSSLPRSDLRIVASERPFLHALSNVSRQLIYVPDDPARRMGVVRSVVSHLKRGGAALTFPAGEIEPDPACMPGAVDSLESWSESIAVFARLVPETRLLVAIVSGVIWPASLVHPLTRLGKGRKESERIAASLQILAHMLRPSLRPVAVRVAFSPPMPAGELAAGDSAALMEAIRGQAQRLIASVHPETLKVSETFRV
jgi:1-acyl-sn-glycerol-3-phosphate acyltransferase